MLARVLRDAAIVIGMTVALLAALELTLQWFYPQSLVPTPISGEHFSRLDPDLGLRYSPNAIWRFRHPEYEVEYHIGPHGLRVPALPEPAPSDSAIRVLLLGDSFTFGQGVAYEEAWGAVAERLLRERGQPAKLINAGMQGMDTRSELLLFRELAPRYRPQVVVVGWLINDLYTNRPLSFRPDTPQPLAAEPPTLRDQVFVQAGRARTFHLLQLARRIVTSNDALYTRLYLASPDRGGYLQLPLSSVARRQLQVTSQLLEQLARECAAQGITLVVASIPQQFQVLHQTHEPSGANIDVALYDRELSGLAEENEFTWLATLPDLTAAQAAPADLYFRLDGHLTADGHAVVAQAVAAALEPVLAAMRPR